jgi:hypothetical protein
MHAWTRTARLVTLAVVLGSLTSGAPARAGGLPVELPPSWAKVSELPEGDILEYLQKLPHEPNLLGRPSRAPREQAVPARLRAHEIPEP